jgi:hypothetical protein
MSVAAKVRPSVNAAMLLAATGTSNKIAFELAVVAPATRTQTLAFVVEPETLLSVSVETTA